MGKFQSSVEGAWRRYLRSAVRLSAMTQGQKAVTVALLNLWLHHRNGPKGYIHPGRAKLAKASRMTEKTVSRTLALLRTAGVLCVRKRLRGEGQRPTEYTFRVIPMLELCGAEIPEWNEGELVGVRIEWLTEKAKVVGQMSHHSSTKCPTTGETKCPTDTTSAPMGKMSERPMGGFHHG